MTSTAPGRGAAPAASRAPTPLVAPSGTGAEPAVAPIEVRLAVVAAHRTGYPLHGELVALGARSARVTVTAPLYRLVALPGPGVARGGIVRVPEGGCAVEVELHDLPVRGLGLLLATLPAPLAIGRVELVDGSELGIVCTSVPAGSVDVSAWGSWPAYLAATAP